MAVRTTPFIAAGTWTVDPAHSNVEFTVKHMGIANVRGKFNEFEGTLEVAEDLASSKAHGIVKVASIDTNEEQRDGAPAARRTSSMSSSTRRSRSSRRAWSPSTRESSCVYGDLTMHGITREVKLQVVLQGTDTDPSGNERAGIEVIGALERSDFDMRFNQALGSGDMLVGDRVKMSLDISAVKQA